MRAAFLLVLTSGCATTEELLRRGDLQAACARHDAVFLTHVANDPTNFFRARVGEDLLILEELSVSNDTRQLSGPTIPSWAEVRSPSRALALLHGATPPPAAATESGSTLATVGAILGTVTGVLPAASLLMKRDLVTPAFAPPDEPPEWQPPEPLIVEGKRVRVYERTGPATTNQTLSVFVTWRFGECRQEAQLTWAVGDSLEAALLRPRARLGCALEPPRCQ